MPSETPVRLASTIMVVRDNPHLEVLMVQRHHEIDFMPGALVFPGGKVDPDDSHPDWAAHALGWNDYSHEERAAKIAAAREAFEESGLLFGEGGELPDMKESIALRQSVAKGGFPFSRVVADCEMKIDLSQMVLFARWVTPEFMAKRFDTFFYIARAPADQIAEQDGWETVDAEWMRPNAALELGASGRKTLVFPTRVNLELLAHSNSVEEALNAARKRVIQTITPWLETRADGTFLTISGDTVYGEARERFAAPTS
ncbi:NUDIX hydrolase [Terrarubrum flagellatum]|uniref:NUDIX hydrolase n=1 Tax=Terrirubrum flagellatum TaxID=2895980 RepID=UPI0031455A0E